MRSLLALACAASLAACSPSARTLRPQSAPDLARTGHGYHASAETCSGEVVDLGRRLRAVGSTALRSPSGDPLMLGRDLGRLVLSPRPTRAPLVLGGLVVVGGSAAAMAAPDLSPTLRLLVLGQGVVGGGATWLGTRARTPAAGQAVEYGCAPPSQG